MDKFQFGVLLIQLIFKILDYLKSKHAQVKEQVKQVLQIQPPAAIKIPPVPIPDPVQIEDEILDKIVKENTPVPTVKILGHEPGQKHYSEIDGTVTVD